MDTRYVLVILMAVTAAAICGAAAFLILRLRRRAALPAASASPEAFLLQEATVAATIGPGQEGKIELRRSGESVEAEARAFDPAQALPRGSRVRLIDYRDGAYLVELADEEHRAH